MTRTDDKLNEINSKLDKIDHKLDGPSVVDQYSGLAANSIDNSIRGTVPKLCFAGRALRAKWPKWVNHILDVTAFFIMMVGFFTMVESKIIGAFIILIGFLLLGTSTNKHLQ